MKRGNILTENIVFIILTMVFLAILLLFVFLNINSAKSLEEKYAKQIALLIDAGEPDMSIKLEMSDAFKKARDEKFTGDIVTKNGNLITVQLRNDGSYSYSFFNGADVNVYLDKSENKCVINIS